MFSILGNTARMCDRIDRREMLRVGGIGLAGLTLPTLLRASASGALDNAQFGRAKNIIFLWLQGGPPQHETFDPKPNAPADVRGEFKPIATNVPGIQISELLPRTAAMADKYAIVRSLVTGSDIHSASGYHVLTGYRYQGPNPRQINNTDWPYLGSIVKMLRPSEKLPAYSTVWLPDVMRLNDNVQPAGQTAGFLGRKWEPERVVWDSKDPNSQIQQYKLPPDIPPLRLSSRKSLLDQLNNHFRSIDNSGRVDAYDQQTQEAYSVLTTGRALEAFDIEREPAKARARYGASKWGQCVLLARRLIEAGVRLVHVNWVREEGDNAVDNPMWDTHAQNADRLQDVLCPQFDVGFTALLDDLDQRGLLDETLVVAIGEFGRTPKINANGGRDHWGSVSNFAIAGAGIRGAQVIGESDANGGHPISERLEPQDLTATIFHLLGIGHDVLFRDRAEIPRHVTTGRPIHQLLGDHPATSARRKPEGDLALVPSYTAAKLRNMAFDEGAPLVAIGSARAKGWQALPLAEGAAANGLAVRLVESPAADCAAIGFGMSDAAAAVEIPRGAKAILAQEIRNPRSGQFTFAAAVRGDGAAEEFFEREFLPNFTCRLAIFRYSDISKDVRKIQLLGQREFQPVYSSGSQAQVQRVELSEFLGTRVGNANFAIGAGLGVAIMIEQTAPGALRFPAGQNSHSAWLCVDHVELEFVGKQRLGNME